MACCDYVPGQTATAAGRIGGALVPRGGGAGSRTPQGLIEQIGAALDQAIHGGDSMPGGGGNVSAGGGGGSTSNVIDFPLVNPYKSAVQTGSPITGLTAWPNKGRLREVPDDGSGIPDDEQGFSGLGSLGFSLGPFDSNVYGSEYPYPYPSPSKLQTIIGAIQATLPATIQAIRAQPSNIYPGQTYNPYASNAGGLYPGSQTGAGADIGARTGAAVGQVGDMFSGIVQQHPLLLLGAGAALLLLFMNPPRRR